MTRANAEAALEKVEQDGEFAARIKDAGGPEDRLALLRSEGFDVSKDELRDAFLDKYGGELDQEQLDALAGGVGFDVNAMIPKAPPGAIVLLTATIG